MVLFAYFLRFSAMFPRFTRDFATSIFISALLKWQDYMVGLFKKRNYLKRIFLQISRFYENINQSKTALFYWSFPFLGARKLKRNEKNEMTKVIVCDCPKYPILNAVLQDQQINPKLKQFLSVLFYYDIFSLSHDSCKKGLKQMNSMHVAEPILKMQGSAICFRVTDVLTFIQSNICELVISLSCVN